MRVSGYVFARVVALSLLAVASAISAMAGGNPDDKAILSRTADVDGVRLHYLTAGNGPAVVILLHGYAETSRMWRPILPLLAARFRVIAPDLPGIGDSAIPASGLDMKSAANSIHALARKLGDFSEVEGSRRISESVWAVDAGFEGGRDDGEMNSPLPNGARKMAEPCP